MRLIREAILQQVNNRDVSEPIFGLQFYGNGGVSLAKLVTCKHIEIDLTINEITSTNYFLWSDSPIGGIRFNGTNFLIYGSLGYDSTLPQTIKTPGIKTFEAKTIDATSDDWDAWYDGNYIGRSSNIGLLYFRSIGYRDGYPYTGIITKVIARSSAGDVLYDADFTTGAGTTLFDKSGNNNHGTINGATWVEI